MSTPEYANYCIQLKEKELNITSLKKKSKKHSKKNIKLFEDYEIIHKDDYKRVK